MSDFRLTITLPPQQTTAPSSATVGCAISGPYVSDYYPNVEGSFPYMYTFAFWGLKESDVVVWSGFFDEVYTADAGVPGSPPSYTTQTLTVAVYLESGSFEVSATVNGVDYGTLVITVPYTP